MTTCIPNTAPDRCLVRTHQTTRSSDWVDLYGGKAKERAEAEKTAEGFITGVEIRLHECVPRAVQYLCAVASYRIVSVVQLTLPRPRPSPAAAGHFRRTLSA